MDKCIKICKVDCVFLEVELGSEFVFSLIDQDMVLDICGEAIPAISSIVSVHIHQELYKLIQIDIGQIRSVGSKVERIVMRQSSFYRTEVDRIVFLYQHDRADVRFRKSVQNRQHELADQHKNKQNGCIFFIFPLNNLLQTDGFKFFSYNCLQQGAIRILL